MSLKKISHLLISFWPLAIPIVWFLLIQEYDGAYIFPSNGEIINYPMLHNARKIPVLLSFCVVPISSLATAILFTWKIRKQDAVGIAASTVTLALLFCTNIMACWSTFGIALSRFEHFARADIKDHVYYIDSIWKVGVGHDSRALFGLFECDSEGVMCKMVHSEYLHPTEEEYEAMQVALIPHPDGNRISMQIDGEIVYTHSP